MIYVDVVVDRANYRPLRNRCAKLNRRKTMSEKFNKIFCQRAIKGTVYYTLGGSNSCDISGEELYQAFKERLMEELNIAQQSKPATEIPLRAFE